MNPLVTNRRVLTWLCIYPAREGTTRRQKRMFIAFSLVSATTIMWCFLSGLAFFMKYVTIDLEMALQSVFILCSAFGALYVQVVLLLSRQKIKSLFDQLTDIYDKHVQEETLVILMKANENCEWIWLMYYKYMILCFVMSTALCVISLLICWFADGTIDVDRLYHMFPLIFPWDERTIRAYIFEIFFCEFYGQFYFVVNGSVFMLFISMCIHHQAFLKIFQHEMRKLKGNKTTRNQLEILCKVIQFHVTVKSWFQSSADFYSQIVAIQLVYNQLMMSCGVFLFDLQLQHPSFDMFTALLLLCTVILNLFMQCFVGKVSTENFQRMADCLYDADWIELPVDLQKYVILMLGNTQKPLNFHGFGIVVLNLETFCKLLKAVFTYYMMFKTITTN